MHYWQDKAFELLMSSDSFDELQRVLTYPKIRARITESDQTIAELLTLVKSEGEFITPTMDIQLITEDPSDDLYLEIAVTGGARFIVTGDQYLLKPKQYQGVDIITPVEFLTVLQNDLHNNWREGRG